MVLGGIKDGLEIRDGKHKQSRSMTVMYSFLLGLDLLELLVLMFSTVFTIGFLAETPHTVDVFHVLFAITRYRLEEAIWKAVSVVTDLPLLARPFPQGTNLSAADKHNPGQSNI